MHRRAGHIFNLTLLTRMWRNAILNPILKKGKPPDDLAGFPRSGKRSGIIFSIPDLEKVGKNDFFQ